VVAAFPCIAWALPPKKGFAEGVEEHADAEHHEDESEGKGVSSDFLEGVIDLHRGATGEVENERSAEFGEGPDEDDGAAGEESGGHQRKGDAPEFGPSGGAEIFGGFLHGMVDVGEGGGDIQVEYRVE